MEHVKEMLLFGAGLAITVTLIFVGFSVFKKAMQVGQLVTEREDQKLEALRNEEIEKYEGQSVQGNKIVSYVRALYGKVDATIKITVLDALSNPSTFDINDTSLQGLRDESSSYFINPMKKYKVSVVRDKNDSITCININQQ